ncbi:hypothetical protein PMAYCL1PPCAC_02023, partial [Pristionchus mayeri]
MAILFGLLLVPAVVSQALYGINQLDSYSRIIQSNNIGGLGLLQDAIARGKVHNVETEVLGTPKLSGLPPLPEHAVQRGTPLLDSDALAPPRRVIHSKRTEQTTVSPPSNIWGVNPIPELPPRHESKLGGYYDEDGEFHQFEKKSKRKEKRRKVTDDEEIPHVITPIGRIDESPHPISSSHRVTAAPAPFHSLQPRPSKLERRVRRVREQHRAVPRQVAPATTTPEPFNYRPKSKPMGRAPEDNNLLAEVEEYDDWLDRYRYPSSLQDQREAYQALYPGRRVSNPYENVPPGSVLFQNVPPRPENPPPQPQQPQPQFQPGAVPPPPPLNPQFLQQPQFGPFPGGPPFPAPAQLFHSQGNGPFPTLSNPLFPPHPQLNPTGTHFVAPRAITNPGADPKRLPGPVQVHPQLGPGQHRGPLVMPPHGGPPTPPPGMIVSIPPGGRIPPGFFPIAAPPQLVRPPHPPSLEHILETRDRLAPKSPFENPLVTFFSKLFGKPSGAQSV